MPPLPWRWILAIKWLLAAIFLFGCTWDDLTPDQFYTSYGMGMQETGSLENSWPLDTGDFQIATVGLSWDIGPRAVELIGPLPMPTTSRAVEVAIPVPAEEVATQDAIADAIETFTTLDLASRIMVVVMSIVLVIVFRKQIGRLIPKFGNNNK